MYKYLAEEFQFYSDLKHRSNLFVSLLKNKDTISALLLMTGVSILFFNLQNFIGYYTLLLFPAVLGLYLLIAYHLLLSFINFKLNVFNIPGQLKDSVSGQLASYISKFVGSNGLEMDKFLGSVINDAVKAIWSVISGMLGTLLKKIREKRVLRKFKLQKKLTISRKKSGFYKRLACTISESHTHFWQFIKELVALFSPKNSEGRGFSKAYWSVIVAFYYKIPLSIIKRVYLLIWEFLISIPKRIILFLFAIPKLVWVLLCLIVTQTINTLVSIIFITIGSILAIPLAIIGLFKSIFNLLKLLYLLVKFIVSFPAILYRLIKRAMLFLKGFTVYQKILGFFALSFLLLSMTLPLVLPAFEVPTYIPNGLISSMSEFSAIIVIFTIVIFLYTAKTRIAYLSSIAVLFTLAVIYGAYFVLLASLVLLYLTASPIKKSVYLIFFYLISLMLPVEYAQIFIYGCVAFLLLTDYEKDIDFPRFLFLALHGSYQELKQILEGKTSLHVETSE